MCVCMLIQGKEGEYDCCTLVEMGYRVVLKPILAEGDDGDDDDGQMDHRKR